MPLCHKSTIFYKRKNNFFVLENSIFLFFSKIWLLSISKILVIYICFEVSGDDSGIACIMLFFRACCQVKRYSLHYAYFFLKSVYQNDTYHTLLFFILNFCTVHSLLCDCCFIATRLSVYNIITICIADHKMAHVIVETI